MKFEQNAINEQQIKESTGKQKPWTSTAHSLQTVFLFGRAHAPVIIK
jgi:hypothetical protein